MSAITPGLADLQKLSGRVRHPIRLHLNQVFRPATGTDTFPLLRPGHVIGAELGRLGLFLGRIAGTDKEFPKTLRDTVYGIDVRDLSHGRVDQACGREWLTVTRTLARANGRTQGGRHDPFGAIVRCIGIT